MKAILIVFLFALSQSDRLFPSYDYIDPYHDNIGGGGNYNPPSMYQTKGDVILREDEHLSSDNKKYFVKLEKNGELILFEELKNGEAKQKEIWRSKTGGKKKGKFSLYLEREGNLLLRQKLNDEWKTIWETETGGMGFQPYEFKVTDYGQICILDGHYEEIWCN